METPPFGISLALERDEARRALKEAIAHRLEAVCVGWSEEDFASLVDQVASTTLKYNPQLKAVISTERD